jgi:hypothetical protein
MRIVLVTMMNDCDLKRMTRRTYQHIVKTVTEPNVACFLLGVTEPTTRGSKHILINSILAMSSSTITLYRSESKAEETDELRAFLKTSQYPFVEKNVAKDPGTHYQKRECCLEYDRSAGVFSTFTFSF